MEYVWVWGVIAAALAIAFLAGLSSEAGRWVYFPIKEMRADGGAMEDEGKYRATLACDGRYTSFTFGDRTIRFRTSRALLRYIEVKEWDKGYLVVTAEYDGAAAPVEEYIDLVPILQDLYYDPQAFLGPIREVLVA
ncbi:DUF7724 family protein [Thermophilibacter provencensis]|uniref:DUF7724 domain-containing protein n=2 Tax=Thermophilibacter provencensis TaxID=1852386 RepID=A0A921KMJ9_9ACTN|nr:hypothetical protein [Thermophilibacter provencensis]HJF44846.1 hypothetical protein [Thermophilibacter provencensis]